MQDLEKAKKFFAADQYATKTTGIEIVAVGDKYAKCVLPLDDRHKNALGHVMGGVPYTLADFVFAVAANFNAESPTVTTTSHITYLAPVQGDRLYGESRLLRDGKRNCYYEVIVSDEQENPVAIVMFCGTHL